MTGSSRPPEQTVSAQEHAQQLPVSILPVETFAAFKAAIEAPGKIVPGLARSVEASEGLLKDSG